jgi:RNA polymerase sigma factor (sigma-70 family)
MSPRDDRSSEQSLPLAEIAGRIAHGDRAAENEFVLRFERGIRALVRRRLRPYDPELDDLVQDVFRIVLEKLRAGAVRELDSVAAFVQTTVVFVTNNEFRRRTRLPNPASQATLEALPDEREPSRTLDATRLGDLLRKMLAELTIPRDRQALELFYLAEQPTETVCATLGLKPPDFYLVLSRARRRFREILIEAGVREATP